MRSLRLRCATALSSRSLAVLGLVLCSAHARAQAIFDDVEPSISEIAPLGTSCAAAPEKVPEDLDATEWSSIRAAYESNRHAAFAVGDGYQARNPGQHWLTRFDGRGVSTQPDAGDWSWGLELESYGFAGDEYSVCEPLQVSAHGPRVTYDWNATLQEWWVNDTRGLEHGFTVHERPSRGDDGPLTFTLAVRGDLIPRVQDGGRGVQFSNADGVDVLTYAGLAVFDEDGQALPARFERIAASLRLSIDERGARYPLTIDPVAQQAAYLKASNTDAGDSFGYSVSVSSDTVVVGALSEDSNATGVNGNQADDSATDSGAAYVFVRSGTSWTQQAYLKASNTDVDDRFGWSVSVSGDTIVVGTVNEASSATGVNGNQADDGAVSAGAAYVFVRSGTTWSQEAYLKASNTEMSDQFGYSVSVSGNTLVIGAPGEDSNATGVNGNQADNGAVSAGAAYVFVRSGTTWSQEAYLKASNAGADDLFGASASTGDGNWVVIGSPLEDSNATGVNGNQADNSASLAGAAYIFKRSGTTWSQQAYLKASNTEVGDEFGGSVSAWGDSLVVVGAGGEDSNATGVNGNQADNSASLAGAAYVFVRNPTLSFWSQQAYLKASNTETNDDFGDSVSVSGDTVVIGARGEDSNATGVNGNQSDNSAFNAGAAYVFVRSGTTWSQKEYLKASNTDAMDLFGFSVSVSGDSVVVGAEWEDSGATGINGNQADNSSPDAGAAYLFVESPGDAYCFGDGLDSIVTAQCPCSNFGDPGHGCANSNPSLGGALLNATGTTSPNTITFTATGLPNNNLCTFLRGTANTPAGVVFSNGVKCVSGTVLRFGQQTSGQGGNPSNTVQSATTAVAAGSTRYYQLHYRNPLGAPGCTPPHFNISNGYKIIW